VAEWILRDGQAKLVLGHGTAAAEMAEGMGLRLSGPNLEAANALGRTLGTGPVGAGVYGPDSGVPFLLGLLVERSGGRNVWAEPVIS
jgi:hypothetical protein